MNQSERLKELRIAKGLTQLELAKATGISKSAIGRLETGERTGTIEALTTLANFYNVSLDYLTCNPQSISLVDDIIQSFIDKKIIIPGEPISTDTQNMIIKILEDTLKSKRNQS